MTPQAALDHGLGELALALPADAPEQLLRYVELLAKWNRTYNLTAIRDPLEMVSQHLLDSLAVIPHLPMSGANAALADVGSEARVEAWLPVRPFEVVISRAFADLGTFIAACGHLVARGGTLAAMKGAFPRDELQRLPSGCTCGEAIRLHVPLLDAERHLVLCRPEN